MTFAGALVILFGIGAAIFLGLAIPLRRKRPELLRNGLWFMLPFPLLPLAWLFTPFLALAALAIVAEALYKRNQKKTPLFYAALGELTAGALMYGLASLFSAHFPP